MKEIIGKLLKGCRISEIRYMPDSHIIVMERTGYSEIENFNTLHLELFSEFHDITSMNFSEYCNQFPDVNAPDKVEYVKVYLLSSYNRRIIAKVSFVDNFMQLHFDNGDILFISMLNKDYDYTFIVQSPDILMNDYDFTCDEDGNIIAKKDIKYRL